jgi:hypothetical protein
MPRKKRVCKPKPKRKCTLCEENHLAKGLCRRHYNNKRNCGDPRGKLLREKEKKEL